MGRVSTFLKRGKIFDIEIFADAARRSQAHQVAEREKGGLKSQADTTAGAYATGVRGVHAQMWCRRTRNNSLSQGEE